MAVTEIIKVIVEFIDNNVKPALQKISNSINSLKQKIKKVSQGMNKFGKNTKFLGIQMIGVVFFANMLAASLTGLLRPAMDTVGMFQLWNDLLTLFFLPIMLALLPLFLELFEILTNQPDSVKILVGALTLLLLIFFKVLGFLGLMVGLFSKAGISLKGLGTIIKFIGTIIKFIGALFSWVGLIILAIAIGIYDAFQKNFMNIQGVFEELKLAFNMMFSGLMDIVKGVMDVIVGIFTGDADKIEQGVKNIFFGVMDFLRGLGLVIGNSVRIVIIGAINIVKNIVSVYIDSLMKHLEELRKTAVFVINLFRKAVGMSEIGYKSPTTSSSSGSSSAFTPNIPSGGFSSAFSSNNDLPKSSAGITINQVVNADITNSREFSRLIDENNKKLTNQLASMVNQ